ncbi:MAG TPA: MarR family transcriptional regulator [Acidimicrobiia bacterium]|nr:MarR family transcriptional regulator [Acidimicrobiia bacterium]
MNHGSAAATDNGRLSFLSQPPTGDWRQDIERPPLGSLISMLFRASVDRVNDHMAERGISGIRPSHLYILRALHPSGLSVTELAERCEVTKQAISQLLEGLENMGIVRRNPDPSDRRGKVVTLTKRGENVLATAVTAWGEVEMEWAHLLDGIDMRDVRDAIIRFLESYGNWHAGEQPKLRPVW